MSVIALGGAVAFTNLSSGLPAPTYEWDFGDGSPSSSATHPTHTYNSMGIFTVSLTATNPYGQDIAYGTVRVEMYRIYLPLIMRNAAP